MWNEKYNETRRLKRQMAARMRKAERLQALKQIVEQQEYLNDTQESLEYYKLMYPTQAIDVWNGARKETFCCAQCCAKAYGLDISIIRKLVAGQYSTTRSHTKGGKYFCPAGYYEWLGTQKVELPALEEEITMLTRYFSS